MNLFTSQIIADIKYACKFDLIRPKVFYRIGGVRYSQKYWVTRELLRQSERQDACNKRRQFD